MRLSSWKDHNKYFLERLLRYIIMMMMMMVSQQHKDIYMQETGGFAAKARAF